ncbi:MAG: type II toxin-antitoxin system HigB family toxin [Anaerolineales bacterium]|nr:type II toxin-antitoxin system HigB family toxin [Anaerolineales bacterium]
MEGNKYRIIAAVQFELQIVFIRLAGAHAEYGQVDADDPEIAPGVGHPG